MASVTFEAPALARAVEALTPAEIDALPFGAIRVAEDGTVAFYSAGERRLSGYGNRPTVGLRFFTDIAPCMNTPAFAGRIVRAQQEGTLDIEFEYVGDFDDREKELRVRVQSASAGGFWIFMQRL